MTDTEWAEIGRRLREPMPSKQRPGRGSLRFNYIDARQVQDRLDDVVGPGNWSTAFKVLSLEPAAVECTLTVLGVSKADAGYSNDPDSDHESEPLKAAYSDAFKRAAVHFGIGRFLYGDTPGSAGLRTESQQGNRQPSRMAAAPAPMPQAAAVPPAKAQPDKDGRYYCAAPDCGVVLTSYEFEGRTVLPQTLADQSYKRFGLVFCLEHATAAKQGLAS